jgi:IS5 family transposase
MNHEEFITEVFCLVDDHFKQLTSSKPIRHRGPHPKLYDSEVITMEIVGEFLEIDKDKGIWEYFSAHAKSLFPHLGDRTSFVRQSANLWYWKQKLQQKFAEQLGAFADDIHMVDGLPIPVCGFKRAHFSKYFRGEAAFGHCEAKEQTYYGFRGHLLINFSGVITGFTLTPANVDERKAMWDVTPQIHGLLLGDKGYIAEDNRQQLREQHIDLQTSLRKNMPDDRPSKVVALYTSTRRLVETVIGQLSERLHIEKVRARDLWHLSSRLARKLLAHTVGIILNRRLGRDALQFDGLISH